MMKLLLLFSMPVLAAVSDCRTLTATSDSAKIPGTLTDYPALVSLTNARYATVANGGMAQNASGYDVQFFSNSTCTTKLDWDREYYDATTGNIIAWIKVSSLTTSAVVYMGVGDSGISTDQANPTAVWSAANAVGVFHLNRTSGTTDNDSTSNANNLTAVSSTEPNPATGQIDGGLDFDGVNDTSARTASLTGLPTLQSSQSISLWYYAASTPAGNQILWNLGDSGSACYKLIYRSSALRMEKDGTNLMASAGTPTAAQWNMVHYTYNSSGTASEIFINGVSAGTGASGANSGAISQIRAGASSSAGELFDGLLDEGRHYTGVLTGNWITTDYANQNDPATFWTLGSTNLISSNPSPIFFGRLR